MLSELEPKPFLRWAGSKRKLLPILIKYWKPTYHRYFEPFVGSAQLFYSIKEHSKFVLSDKNNELIETYLRIRNNPYEVHRILKGFTNSKKSYYEIRALNPRDLGVNQRAARFIFLNWLCFNGLYRTNVNGQFNVPYSGESAKSLDNWSLLKRASGKLQSALILEGDFEVVVRSKLGANDFVYLDPPYALENQRIFTQYCNHTFGLKDIERLSALLEYINSSGSFFLMSYANTAKTSEIFKHWNVREVLVQRNIAGFSEYRRKSSELLITNIF